jgi:uncharacterized protein (UPF0276 family)
MKPRLGLAWDRGLLPTFDEPSWTAVEIPFGRIEYPLGARVQLGRLLVNYVSLQAPDLRLTSADGPTAELLDALGDVASENGAEAISALAGWSVPRRNGISIRRLQAAPLLDDALDLARENILCAQRRVGCALFVENPAHAFLYREAVPEAEFFSQLLFQTGCGLSLDLTSVHANVINFGYDGPAFVTEVLRAASRVQLHLSGGYFNAATRRYRVTRSRGVPEEAWALYRDALEQGGDRVEAVFLRRDLATAHPVTIRAELHRAGRLAAACARAAA